MNTIAWLSGIWIDRGLVIPISVKIRAVSTITSAVPGDFGLMCSLAIARKSLQRDGVRVWLDGEHIKPGDNIPVKIEEGLEHLRVLVLCSRHLFKS